MHFLNIRLPNLEYFLSAILIFIKQENYIRCYLLTSLFNI